MKHTIILLLGLLLMTSSYVIAQDIPRTEEYAFLELSTQCRKGKLLVTNNAKGTKLSQAYKRKESTLTDDERILLAMNDLNAKGFKLKSTTTVAEKCRFKRVFLFYKSRPSSKILTTPPD